MGALNVNVGKEVALHVGDGYGLKVRNERKGKLWFSLAST